MEQIVPLLTQLGPWGLLALCVVLGSSGVIALVLVLWWLPKFIKQMLDTFKEQIAAEREAYAGRLDRIESKIDGLRGPRLAEHTRPGPDASA